MEASVTPEQGQPVPRARSHAGASSAYREYTRRKLVLIASVAAGTLILAVLAIALGSAGLSFVDVLETLVGRGDPRSAQIVIHMRLLRVLTATIAGAGLALAGCIMQNVLQNSLASDYTLGISQGAAFGAAVAILALGAGATTSHDALLAIGPYLVTLSAFTGAMLVTSSILLLARYRGMTPEAMVLAGVALGSLFSAGTVLAQYFASDVQIASIVFWTFGDIGRASWEDLGIIAAVTLSNTLYFMVTRWDYNVLCAGEESARTLGVDVEKTRMTGMLLASLMTATAVSFLGIIAFVGLVAPHLMRRAIGGDHRYLAPASALAGAFLLLASDTFGRTIIAPVVLPVGAVTSLMGAPLFIVVLRGFAKRGFRSL
jgi:iron complex transport system permease protein